ncbi:hypothetical protein JW711_00805 [Candidatus Woesearchaeota archaeon]|nr:hypothetical protein [Candidatus Woesearchaeota archaeon]
METQKSAKGATNVNDEKPRGPECMVCGGNAEYCMRGIPKNTYCKDCAEAYFQLLEYLDKL